MLQRRLALPLAALTLLGLSTTGCADQAAAIRVGDDTVSASDFTTELDTYANDEQLLGLLPAVEGNQSFPAEAVPGDLRGGYNMDFVQFVLQNRIVSMLREDLLEDEELTVPADQRDALREALESDLRQAEIDVDAISGSFLDQVVEDFIIMEMLNAQMSAGEQSERLLELATRTDIEVSSHYGSWDTDRLRQEEPPLQPPLGPEPAPDAPDAATPG